TREICIEYAKKHPDKIRLFLHRRENVIIIGGQPTGRFNFLYNLKEARGKYIALCEGDDYWTDPHKLQKQVDFLENHTEYSACAHDVDVFFEDEFKRKIYFYNKDMHYFNEAMHYFYPTCSVVFRANLINENNVKLLSNPKLRGGDKLLQMIFFKFGPIKYIDQKMGVYRKHASGVSFERKKKDYDSTKAFLNAVLTIYDKKHRKNIHKRIVVAYADKSRDLRLSKQWLDFLSSFMGAILHVKSFTSLKILLKDSFKSN
ncbi:MAG: glycosyltransferase, partial [bacterium]